MTWRGLAKGDPEEFFERQAVIDLVFEFGIGIDAKPLLQQHAFKQQYGRVCVSAFAAGPAGVVTE